MGTLADRAYLSALHDVFVNGKTEYNKRTDRTVKRLFGVNYKVDLKNGWPVLNTKELPVKKIIAENLWFLSGQSDINELREYTNIWDKWADENGGLPSAYGYYWRNSPTVQRQYPSEMVINGDHVDQLKHVVEMLGSDRSSRRALVVAWHPYNALASTLPPCHFAFQFLVYGDELNVAVFQRSGDMPLGVPWNIAGYGFIAWLVARELGIELGELFHVISDAHIYSEQFDGVREHLKRFDLITGNYPKIKIVGSSADKSMFDLNLSDVENIIVEGYKCQKRIKFPKAV